MHGVSQFIVLIDGEGVIDCESILDIYTKRGRYCCSQRIIQYFTHLARFTKAITVLGGTAPLFSFICYIMKELNISETKIMKKMLKQNSNK